MHDETRDFVFFDPEDIDWALTRAGGFDQAEQILDRTLKEEEVDFLREQAALFFDSSSGNEINRPGGEAAGILGKYHYKLSKTILGLLEFVIVESAAIAVAAITPPVGVTLSLVGPGIAVFGAWREAVTRLDHDELLVLTAMTDLIKSDYRILREEGVSESEIKAELQRKGLSVPDLSGCLERLCGDVGEKKVVIKTRGAGGVFRYTPMR